MYPPKEGTAMRKLIVLSRLTYLATFVAAIAVYWHTY